MHDKITILMATYNGERFLSEQLDSIINQTYTNWELWIRDDSSSDKTLEIIENYCVKDKRIKHYKDELKNLGCVRNFGTLLNNTTNDSYVMFCDQDDVWLPFKIEITLNKMKELEKFAKKPTLIYSPLQKVDIDLNKIEVKNYDLPKNITINKIISQNFIYGCTMMLNKELIELVNPISENAENHDYWIAMIAAYCGQIGSVDKPTILYRQHTNNVSGSYKDSSFKLRLKRLFNNKYHSYIKQRLIMIEALIIHLKYKGRDTYFLDKFLESISKGGLQGVSFIIENKAYKYGTNFLSNAIYLISIFRFKGLK